MSIVPPPKEVLQQDEATLANLRDSVIRLCGGEERLQVEFPNLIRDALDFVLDSVRTARTRLSELDNVEKTFIGLKLEHYVRDMLGAPKGLRDLVVDGIDMDIKNTTGKTWMIPPESYRNADACLLMKMDENAHKCWLGLFIARPEYLTKPNRDGKCGVSAFGMKSIVWLLNSDPFPKTRFTDIDMARFLEMRQTIKAGAKRYAQFARENLGLVVHRDVIQSLLYDQKDFMKRLRKNGGAEDILSPEGVGVLIGTYFQDRNAAVQFGIPNLRADEIVAVKAETEAQAALLNTVAEQRDD